MNEMNPWEEFIKEAESATYIRCRVIKQIGSDLFSPNKVGDEIEVEEKGVKELVDEGYIEVIKEDPMNKLESIKETIQLVETSGYDPRYEEYFDDVKWLIQRLEIAQKALEEELNDAKTWENRGTIKRIESALDQLKE